MDRQKKYKNDHFGSSFDSFLVEAGIREEVLMMAQRKVVAGILADEMKRQRMNRNALALRMKTRRTVVDRLLDESDHRVTLITVAKAATALGLHLMLVPD
jgi:antitoxin HicB